MNRWLDRWLVDSIGWRLFVAQTIARDIAPRVALPRNARILDIGGGAGAAVKPLLKAFPGSKVTMIDPDPKMLDIARKRLWSEGDRVYIEAMNVDRLSFDDDSFDAVLCFEVLHHVVRWREALTEIKRVLKPGGALLVAEALRGLIALPGLRTVFPHPEAAHFSSQEFLDGVYQAGFAVPGNFSDHAGMQLVGVARK